MTKENKSKFSDEEIQAFQRREEQRQEREYLIESIQAFPTNQELSIEELRTVHKMLPKFREISKFFELTKILSRTF